LTLIAPSPGYGNDFALWEEQLRTPRQTPVFANQLDPEGRSLVAFVGQPVRDRNSRTPFIADRNPWIGAVQSNYYTSGMVGWSSNLGVADCSGWYQMKASPSQGMSYSLRVGGPDATSLSSWTSRLAVPPFCGRLLNSGFSQSNGFLLVEPASNFVVTVVVGETSNRSDEIVRLTDRRVESLRAFGELEHWLQMPAEAVATIAEVAPRTLAYWRSGATTPHASKVRRLFQIHSLVRSLIDLMGVAETQSWLTHRNASSLSRLEQLGEPDGPAQVLREASSILFPARPHRSTVPLLEEDHPLSDVDEPPPSFRTRRVRRRSYSSGPDDG
jgi:hypothetical protein